MSARPPFLLYVTGALALAAAISLFACSPSAEHDYAQSVRAARAAKDEMLRSGRDSPVPAGKRSTILPLGYFPPDESFRVPASLEPGAASSRAMDIDTSTGQRRHMTVIGVLAMTVKGQRVKLTAFAEEGSNGDRLFVPFTDATSGHETYGGGRYLDLDRSKTGIYVVDFNTAYNPYCAYNPSYDCPVPPRENQLPLAIRAGEKLPGTH